MLISQPQIGLFISFKKEKLSSQSLVFESGIALKYILRHYRDMMYFRMPLFMHSRPPSKK